MSEDGLAKPMLEREAEEAATIEKARKAFGIVLECTGLTHRGSEGGVFIPTAEFCEGYKELLEVEPSIKTWAETVERGLEAWVQDEEQISQEVEAAYERGKAEERARVLEALTRLLRPPSTASSGNKYYDEEFNSAIDEAIAIVNQE